ncbi:hypothetical protein N7453_000375 [Penicillium expansum]|nr:hypothetical protein N7453_000375 [Penicillium expansum]
MSHFRFQYGHRPRSRSSLLIRKFANTSTRIYQSTALGNFGKPSQNFLRPKRSSGQIYRETSSLLPQLHFRTLEEYLEAHYALIREDSVAPLRNAVARILRDISIYEKVFVVGVTLARAGLALHIQFSTRRAGKNIAWTYSNRLNPGAVVALSPKNNAFSSKCVVAVVACRLLEGVEKDPPEVDLFLASPDDIEVDPQQEWVMVEARAGYFEANRHTLTALQKLSKESFPLNEQICSLYDIIERWPSKPMGKLDISQWSALNRMLTKKLAIIQGPPGTGKTFTSIAALRMMLSNKGPMDPPIIITAQTNHALDQLIKHISVFEKNYVRLGGRTSDPEIRKRTPYEIRQNQGLLTIEGGLMTPMRKKQNKIAAELDKLLKPLAPSGNSKPLAASLFLEHGLLSQDQVDSLQETANKWQQFNTPANADPLAAWLADSVREFDSEYAGDFGFIDDDIDLEYEQLKEIEVEHGRYEDDWSSFRTRFSPLSPGLCSSNTARISRATVENLLKEKDFYKIHKRYRGAIYDYLRQQLIAILGEHVQRLAQTYQDCSANFQIGRFERDYCILQEAKIIGMTTTGLSKYRGLVSSLNPRVILIEEAAEVLEAPVAVSCLPSLQHLILVGDHQQLRGQCAGYDLCGDPFNLDVSMFERLMKNKMPYAMLQEQRRMVPEIRKLVAPMYGDLLRDHPSVEDHPLVPGMGDKRSFFFDHTAHESNDSLLSKVNDFEASMVVNLLAYLVMNKVPPASITVLTFYNGQRKLIMRKKSQNQNVSKEYVNILTVDSYQGEENDIVLLSLVRSNDHRGIGFLAQDNRVCVALSRAKYGLYIFGNAQCVSKHSDFWYAVTNVMSENHQDLRIGRALPLYCARHNQETLIENLKDWNAITDGCNKPCGKDLPCGHPCPRKCHGSEHDWVSCKQRCREIRECCNTPCICVCSPPHTHDCFCGMGKDSKTQVFDAGSDWDDFDRDDDDRDERVVRRAEGVRRWQEFAQGGAELDDYRRAGLTVGGKLPQKDATPVKQGVTAPVEGILINFDDNDNLPAAVPGTEESQPTAPAMEDMLTYDGAGDVLAETMIELQDMLPIPPEKDLMTFDQDDHSRAEGVSPEKNQLPAAVHDNDNLASSSSLAYMSLTPSVMEDVTPPAEGQLIELS